MDPHRAAWLRKFSREPEPWSGPVHAAPLLADLTGRVIELGAGGGKVGDALPRDVLAMDWAALPPGRPGVWADAHHLPLRDASVDAVVAIHVIGHLDAPRSIAEIRRVLRPQGILALEVFAAGDARDGKGVEVAPRTFAREGIATRYFEPEVLRGWLTGFAGALVPEERAMRWGVRRILRGRFVKD